MPLIALEAVIGSDMRCRELVITGMLLIYAKEEEDPGISLMMAVSFIRGSLACIEIFRI